MNGVMARLTSPFGLVLTVALTALLVSGCGPGLGASTVCAAGETPIPPGTIPVAPRCAGECDPAAARTLVYNEFGEPMYAGQALVIHSCANTCHNESTAPMSRFGAPLGLDFDLRPITSADDEGRAAELSAHHAVIVAHAGGLFGAVAGGTMPPGEVGLGEEIAEFAYVVSPADPTMDVDLARVITPEGRELLRNWLVCGAPFVERTIPCPSGTCAGDVVPLLSERAP